jgi:hypothetical protein
VDEATAAVIAAAIAFGASLISLIVSTVAASRGEAAAAHRETLGPFLHRLGKASHEAVASSEVLFRRDIAGQDVAAWREAGEQAEAELKQLRLDLRYPLFGIDEAVRTLSRVPRWAAVYKGHESGRELLADATKLRKSFDRAVARSYARGRPPSR